MPEAQGKGGGKARLHCLGDAADADGVVAFLETAGARDCVEYPSQVNEMWATYPEVLSNYAKHYRTGETIPAEMIEKLA